MTAPSSSWFDSSSEWTWQEQLISRFEDAWQQGDPPALEAFLPADAAQRSGLLPELAAIDLEYRLKAGGDTAVENYLRDFPELSTNRENVLRLAEVEYRIRRRREPELTAAQIADRFPQHRQELIQRLQDLPDGACASPPDRLVETVRWGAHTPENPPAAPAGPDTPRDGAPSAARAELQSLGRFLLHEKVGQGGFGAVYRAYDTQLARMVAIKVPHIHGLSAAERERFLAEARNAARLRHAGIVPVYEAGHEGGVPYIVCEFVQGETLAARRARGLSWQEQAELVAAVAEALHYAHCEGVVHRDVKPSNILVALDGTPRLMDFGLAKHLASIELLTTEGDVLGTPAYMSPEQAAGQGHQVDGRADVFSLGVVLYELLTGELPFRGHPRMVLQQVIHDEPVRPRQLNDLAPRDLETICLKAMAKDPARRYATAGELADDLRRYLRGEPIHARPVGRPERIWRWCRRNPRVAILTSAVAILLLALAGGSSTAAIWLGQMAKREQLAALNARTAQRRAEGAEREARAESTLKEQALIRAREESERARREAATTQQVVQFLTNIFTASDPLALEGLGPRQGDEHGAQLTARDLLLRAQRRIDEQLQNQPVVRASLLDTLGNVYRSLGMHAEAEPLLLESLALRREIFGQESVEAATSLFHLAWLRHAQGRFEEAEQGYRQAIAVRERLAGPDDLQTADIRFALAWLHGERAQFETERGPRLRQAADLMQQVLATRRKVLGDKHRQVALAHIGLSWTQFAHHNQFEAIANAGRALSILEAAEGKQDVPSTIVLYMQSVAARRGGDKQKAMDLSRQALATLQRLLGEEHPLAGMLLGDMAGLAHEMGDEVQAEQLIRRALVIGRKMPGGHPLMVDALGKFANALRDRGDFVEAEALYREALEMGLRLLGPEHQNVRQVQQSLETLRQRQAAAAK